MDFKFIESSSKMSKRQRTTHQMVKYSSIPVNERIPLEIFYIIAKYLKKNYDDMEKYYFDKFYNERSEKQEIIDKIRDLIKNEDIDVGCIHDADLCPDIETECCEVCFDQCDECESRVSVDEIQTFEICGNDYKLCDACKDEMRDKLS